MESYRGPAWALFGCCLAALAALTYTEPGSQPGGAQGALRPERLAERFVSAWQARDVATLNTLATPKVVKRALDDPSYQHPEDTPATDGSPLHLRGASQTAGTLTLRGELRWGDAMRSVDLGLDGDAQRIRHLSWADASVGSP